MEELRYVWIAMDIKEKAMFVVRASQRRKHPNPTSRRPDLRWDLIPTDKKFVEKEFSDIDAIYKINFHNNQFKLF